MFFSLSQTHVLSEIEKSPCQPILTFSITDFAGLAWVACQGCYLVTTSPLDVNKYDLKLYSSFSLKGQCPLQEINVLSVVNSYLLTIGIFFSMLTGCGSPFINYLEECGCISIVWSYGFTFEVMIIECLMLKLQCLFLKWCPHTILFIYFFLSELGNLSWLTYINFYIFLKARLTFYITDLCRFYLQGR
ncbi:Uncharacterized protein TCM_007111 [Theobroma cacao]|uniref:Uncharacterized protein n=1 Tax=Theobroma cacao TaxID=3641 RepID=A0A061DZW9_THECC|nr:Uncharacterized protein TCM_007111 [Theobroma cacao]